MLKAKKTLFICFLAVLILALTAVPAISYFLLGASVNPASAYPGDTVDISYTVGDPMVDYGVSQGPYRVEIYYCNAPDPNRCFVCGKASLEYPPIYCLGDWDYFWSGRHTHFNCQGAIKGLIGAASHDGAKLGTTFTMSWTIPTDLPCGKYNIHILVGYEGECDNGTHYTLPFEVLCRGAKISGHKFNDLNGNGKKDPGEPYLKDWTITATKDATIKQAITDDNGYYEFSFGPTEYGTWKIDEVLQAGWVQTSGPYTVEIKSGTNVENLDFGNYKKIGPPTSQITDTNGYDLTTLIFNCKNSKVSSTSPGGLFYWVRWDTGSYSGPVTITVNPVLLTNDFVLHGTNPVKVEVDGTSVYVGNSLTWSGNVGANSKIVMRVHYKSGLIGKACSLVNPSYIFSALVNGMYTEDVLLTSCVKK